MTDKAIKVPGLNGTGKMGKSEGNCIYLSDDPKTIRKKVMSAVTDNGPAEPNSVMLEVIHNLYTIMELVSSKDTCDYFYDKWNNAEQKFYGDMKKQIAEDIIAFTDPIREKIKEYEASPEYLDKVLLDGMDKARLSAIDTMQNVRHIIGIY